MPGRGAATPASHRERAAERGQVLVVFALSITALLGIASVAIDVGRMWTEQRVMQNAADAAALGAGKAVVLGVATSGSTVATARQAAVNILAIDLAGSPVGVPAFGAANPAVYDTSGLPSGLLDGIVFTDSNGSVLADNAALTAIADIRIALRTNVDFLLGRAVGISAGQVHARAHVTLSALGSLLPVAVRRYLGGAGPNNPVPAPCPDPLSTTNTFFDLAATQATDCQWAIDTTSPIGYGGRTPASQTSPGPIIQLVGQGAGANAGGVSFRGFINLDVRNFSASDSRVYYNGMTSGTNSNTAKNLEAGWVSAPNGYPGPLFPPVAWPPDPNDQVGVMDGNAAGKVVSSIEQRFSVGSIVLCSLYDGTVKTTPAFVLSQTQPMPTLTAGTTVDAGQFLITPNKSFTDFVALSVPRAPSWLTVGSVQPTPIQPTYPQGSTFILHGVSTAANTPATIDTLWLRGSDTNQPNQLNAPDYYLPVEVQVGTVAKDFSWLPTQPAVTPTTWGDTVSLDLTITTVGGADFSSGNSIGVSLDQTGSVRPPFPSTSYWFTLNGQNVGTSATVPVTTAVTTNNGNGKGNVTSYTGTVTLNVNTTLLGSQSTYAVPLVMSGTNSSGQGIHHEVLFKVNASTATQNNNYIDISGFAAYRITAMDANTIWGQAVSPVAASASDPQLAAALRPRLVPW
ncbi:MAG TPA: pilus assembly protein TadG-related protein [Candidatus Limnocylindrales bacterium]